MRLPSDFLLEISSDCGRMKLKGVSSPGFPIFIGCFVKHHIRLLPAKHVTLTSDGESISKVGSISNDQIFFTYNPYLACPHVTRQTYVGFKPTVLASLVSAPQLKF